MRSDRVLYFPAPARGPGTNGRPPGTVPRSSSRTSSPGRTRRSPPSPRPPGTAPPPPRRGARLHQRLTSRAGWEDHDGKLPVIEGTLIRLHVTRLPGNRSPEPLWLWTTTARLDDETVNRSWQAFLRRFDIEHTFRFLKQVLGWTRPKLRDPAAADRWTWIILACYAQLWLARGLAEDLRLPWQRPCPPGRAHPRPGPPRVPEHPPGTARSGQRAETRQTRPRPPARLEEPPPG